LRFLCKNGTTPAMKFELAEIPVWIQIGTTAAERAAPQEILVTLRWDFDATRASQSDEIADALDYFPVRQHVERFGLEKEFQLLEKFLAELRKSLESGFPQMQNLKIEVKKFPFESGWVKISD